MKPSQLNQWLKRIMDTREYELSCSDCFEMLDLYVDLELAGVDVENKLAPVKEHFHQCKVCQEEYQLLRELASSHTG